MSRRRSSTGSDSRALRSAKYLSRTTMSLGRPQRRPIFYQCRTVGEGALLRAVPTHQRRGGGHAEPVIGPAYRGRPLAGSMAGSGRTRWLCPPLYGAFCQERCVLPKYFSILWSSFFVRPEGRFSVPTCLGPVTSRADAVKDGRRTDAATRSAFEGHP